MALGSRRKTARRPHTVLGSPAQRAPGDTRAETDSRGGVWKSGCAVGRAGWMVRGAWRAPGASGPSRRSAEEAMDVVLCSRVHGVPEHLLGGRCLNDHSRRLVLRKEERTLLRDAG